MKRLFVLIFILNLFYFSSVSAQSVDAGIFKTPTIYYLADTARIPAKDRMVELRTMKDGTKNYHINAPCMLIENVPIKEYDVLEFTEDERKQIDSAAFKRLSLFTLPQLIDITCGVGWRKMIFYYKVYFIEPMGKQFMVYKVSLLHTTVVN